jgi:hypothetical protein
MSQARIADLVCFQYGLEKVGGVADDLGRAAYNMALTTGVGIGMNLAVKGGGHLIDALTFNRDLDRLIAAYPELKNADPKAVRVAYTSLRQLNPEFAKDPLVGGSMLQAILRNVHPDSPRGMPRFDLATAQILNQARSQNRGGFAEELIRAAALEEGKIRARGHEQALARQHAIEDRAEMARARAAESAQGRTQAAADRAADRAAERQAEDTHRGEAVRRALARLAQPAVVPADPKNLTYAERLDRAEREAAFYQHRTNYRP